MILLMQILIIGVIVYSGLFIGKMLAIIAPEEIRPGRKNLIILQKFLFIFLIITFWTIIDNMFAKLFIVAVTTYCLFYIEDYKLHNNNYYLMYTLIGFFLGWSALSQKLIYPSYLSFLIGMPTATLNHDKPLNVYVKLFLVFFVTLIISTIIFT